ncbi:hypothetical protein [Planococcus plakortidis]|uniref:hypothetical protein n=1 Tax=Planococcus plakortidis TaxID=1038856 RepID=UPI00385AEEBD
MSEKVKGYYLELLKVYSMSQQIFIKYGVSDVAIAIDKEIAFFHREFLKNHSEEELDKLINAVSLELAIQGYSINKETYKQTKGGELK